MRETPSNITVGDVMHRGVLSCRPDASLTEVARIMAEHRVHGVVVDGVRRDAAGMHTVWGVVSDLDLVGRLGAVDAMDATAAELSATPAIVVRPDDPLAEAARLMHDYDVHRLLVISSPDRRPIGIISTLDVAGAVAAGRL